MLNQMQTLVAGDDRDCTDVGNGVMVGATVAGAAVGGPIGFMVGGLIGLLAGTFVSIANAC